jgi:hypothetical protein
MGQAIRRLRRERLQLAILRLRLLLLRRRRQLLRLHALIIDAERAAWLEWLGFEDRR